MNDDAGEPPRYIEPDGRTYVVVMPHNFVDDRVTLETLLEGDAPVPYIGLIGSRERFEELLAECRAAGTVFEDSDLGVIYTPVGLDLGAGSPSGIATSIVAEVLAVYNGRHPDHLAAREGLIHDRAELNDR